MRTPLIIACVGEIATGLALLLHPALVVRLLLGAEIAGAGVIASRVAGLALIALGIACWPGCAAQRGMLTYSAIAAAYLFYLAVRGEWAGPLLWPAVALHAVLTLLLARSWLANRMTDRAYVVNATNHSPKEFQACGGKRKSTTSIHK
jgi:hypothetical protein